MLTPQSHQIPKTGQISGSIHRAVWVATLAVAGLVHTSPVIASDNLQSQERDAASMIHTTSHVHSEIIESVPVGFIKDWKWQKITSNIPMFHFTRWSDGTLTMDMTAFLEIKTDNDQENTVKLQIIKQKILSNFIKTFTKSFPDSKWEKQVFMYCTPSCAHDLSELLKGQKVDWLNLLPIQNQIDSVRINQYGAMGTNTLIVSPKDLWPNHALEELRISTIKDLKWNTTPLALVAGGIGWAALWALSTWYLGRRRKKEDNSNGGVKVVETLEPTETPDEYARLIPRGAHKWTEETIARMDSGEITLLGYIAGNLMSSWKKWLIEYLSHFLEDSSLTEEEDIRKMVILLELDPTKIVWWQQNFIKKHPVSSNDIYYKIVEQFDSINHISKGLGREVVIEKLMEYTNSPKITQTTLAPENIVTSWEANPVDGVGNVISQISATDNWKIKWIKDGMNTVVEVSEVALSLQQQVVNSIIAILSKYWYQDIIQKNEGADIWVRYTNGKISNNSIKIAPNWTIYKMDTKGPRIINHPSISFQQLEKYLNLNKHKNVPK
jgi:hypothetical protein